MRAFLSCLLLALSVPALARFPVVEFDIVGRGRIQVELFDTDAPRTVRHILALIDRGFYNGQRFHRVIPNFVAQVGDPETKELTAEQFRERADGRGGTHGIGGGGSGRNVVFERNQRSHRRGTLGMALSAPASDTGDSQFFFNLKDNTQLDGDYVVFGRVTRGLHLIDSIRRGDQIRTVRRLPAPR